MQWERREPWQRLRACCASALAPRVRHRVITLVLLLLTLAAGLIGQAVLPMASGFHTYRLKGYEITATGLTPEYPAAYECSALTSLYASWTDVDGSRREEPHSGVDGGRLGEPILAPGRGTIRAVWRANWGWGSEGALLISHARDELNLADGARHYYSAFYHLRYRDVSRFKPGQKVARGERIGRVHRPGGKRVYLPEVHWEVYEVEDESAIVWDRNTHGAPYWENKTARLVDPLFMLAQETPPSVDRRVLIHPYISGVDYGSFRGFTYILPCIARGCRRDCDRKS